MGGISAVVLLLHPAEIDREHVVVVWDADATELTYTEPQTINIIKLRVLSNVNSCVEYTQLNKPWLSCK